MLNTRALRIVRSFFTLTLRLIVQTFPVRHCSLTRSLSLRFHASSLDVSATGPKTTKNPRHCPWRDPDISPLTSQLTNPAHHLRIFHFFTHHGPTADRPSVHGTSRHHHHHTLARSLYTVPRSLARLALALARSLLRLSLSLHLRTPSRCERVRYRYTYSMRTHTLLTFRRVACACPSI